MNKLDEYMEIGTKPPRYVKGGKILKLNRLSDEWTEVCVDRVNQAPTLIQTRQDWIDRHKPEIGKYIVIYNSLSWITGQKEFMEYYEIYHKEILMNG